MMPGLSLIPVVFAVLIPACAGSTGPANEVLQVAGTYATAVSLTANSCGNTITVQPNPTVVTHVAGATTISLQHGPVTYSGTVTSAGAFTTQPVVVNDAGNGVQSTLTIAGQFATTGFTADVSVGVVQTQAPTTCAYSVHWVGTKQGSPNTIP
jgi:hypothetical protein